MGRRALIAATLTLIALAAGPDGGDPRTKRKRVELRLHPAAG